MHIPVLPPTATLSQVSMIARWKILCMSDHYSSIHFTSAQRREKTAIWNKACTEWNKKQNLRWLHLSHSHWGSYRDDEPLLPQPSSRSIPGIRPLRSFESATCTIDMLLFFICWLYLIPSLFPLTEQRGSYSRPNSNLCFFLQSGIGSHLHCCGGMCGSSLLVLICVSFVWSPSGLRVVSESAWSP